MLPCLVVYIWMTPISGMISYSFLSICHLTARDRMTGNDYDVPNVPNVLYFDRGYALHGAYWHNNFGTPMSHGCVNLPLGNAQWLFNWAQIGTPVIIHQ